MNWQKLMWVAVAAGLYVAADQFGIPKLEGLVGFVLGGALVKSNGLMKK